jgi:hypothetical protein
VSAPDEIDIQWERDKRERRWTALKEDGAMFGLTPGEAAEFARLDREFATPTPSDKA